MKRLTKTYEDGSHGVADDLPCGENSHAFKALLIDTLGKYEELEMTPNEIIEAIKAIKLFYKDFPRNIGKATDMMPLAIFESKIYKSLN